MNYSPVRVLTEYNIIVRDGPRITLIFSRNPKIVLAYLHELQCYVLLLCNNTIATSTVYIITLSGCINHFVNEVQFSPLVVEELCKRTKLIVLFLCCVFPCLY